MPLEQLVERAGAGGDKTGSDYRMHEQQEVRRSAVRENSARGYGEQHQDRDTRLRERDKIAHARPCQRQSFGAGVFHRASSNVRAGGVTGVAALTWPSACCARSMMITEVARLNVPVK